MILQNIGSEGIARILECYSNLLDDDDRSLIALISAIRSSLDERTAAEIPLVKVDEGGSIEIKSQSVQERGQTIERLLKYEILSYNPSAHSYSIHPLIRSHYQTLLEEDALLAGAVHKFLFNYYLSIDEQIGDKTSLNHLRPLIEAVHHACKCGLYSDAWRIYIKRISGPGDHMLTDRLGAYDTALSIMREFFPREDLEKEPNLNSKRQVSQILGNVGYCLMSLGYLGDALSAFERENAIDREIKYMISLSNGYQNLSRLYTYLGELESATVAARKGIKAAKSTRADHKKMTRHQINSMCMLAWSFHLRGFLCATGELFQKARKLTQDIGEGDILTKFRGFFNASHLMMIGNLQEARIIAESNLTINEKSGELAQISRCHRLIGDLDAAEGEYGSAVEHYDSALKVARDISRKEILIEALLSRGRFRAKNSQDMRAVYSDLSEALKYAKDCGYRIYEVDIRYGLAQAFLAADNLPASRNEALYASQMSHSLGYHWGIVEATKIDSLFVGYKG